MFDVSTFETLLIPQIACGDAYLRGILTTKFNFLYLKNRSLICDDRWVYVKLQLDLISLAMMTARKKVDFLKRIEDTKSNRFYNAGGFVDSTSKRQSEGFATAFSRARSNQDFYRFSESHDKARSDTKAEHHGKTESKAWDASRTEGKSETEAMFRANSDSVGTGKGSSCSASKSSSDSVTSTGSMQPPVGLNGFPKIGCDTIDELTTFFGVANVTGAQIFACIPSVSGLVLAPTASMIGSITCIVDTLLQTGCGQGIQATTTKLHDQFQMIFPKNSSFIPTAQSQFSSYRTAMSLAEFGTLGSLGSIHETVALYSAKKATEHPKTAGCDRAYITPSSGRSWQFSYRFGISFGVALGILSGNGSLNVNLRTQVSGGSSYKESEVCSTGQSKRQSDSSSSSRYRETGKQVSQGHSNTTERTNNQHDAHRLGMSKRDAYSKHSSCSYSTMDSEGRSHTDSARKAHSDSTAFGSGESRKEGHSEGEGKAITRTQAVLESRMYSQIFDNLNGMYKRVQKEFDEVVANQSATAGYSTSFRDEFEWCDTACNTFVAVANQRDYYSANSDSLFRNG